MKVMKVDLGITYGVKMNCGIVSVVVTARTNRKYNNVELEYTFWLGIWGEICDFPYYCLFFRD